MERNSLLFQKDAESLQNLETHKGKLTKIDIISGKVLIAAMFATMVEMGYGVLELFLDRLHKHSLPETIILGTTLLIANIAGATTFVTHRKIEKVNDEREDLLWRIIERSSDPTKH